LGVCGEHTSLEIAALAEVLCTIGNLDSYTPVRELHMAFKIPYDYN
jgi:hypothetical protein